MSLLLRCKRRRHRLNDNRVVALPECARVEEVPAERGSRRLFALTELGRGEFRAWLEGPVDVVTGAAELRARVYFLGMVDAPERRTLLEAMVFDLEQARDDLRAALERARGEVSVRVVPERWRELTDFELLSLELGVEQAGHLAECLNSRLSGAS